MNSLQSVFSCIGDQATSDPERRARQGVCRLKRTLLGLFGSERMMPLADLTRALVDSGFSPDVDHARTQVPHITKARFVYDGPLGLPYGLHITYVGALDSPHKPLYRVSARQLSLRHPS